MKKILLIVLFITGVCFGQTISPCEDERYIVLKNKSLDDMSDREYEYFIRKDKECSEYKILNLEKVNQETAPTNKQESVSLREITNENYNQSVKMGMYEAVKKSPSTAGFLSFLFSSGGHAYAGNWGRGVGFLLGRIITYHIAISTGIEEKTVVEEVWGPDVEYTVIEYNSLYYILLGASVGLAIAEIVDAVKETKKHNERVAMNIFGDDIPKYLLISAEKASITLKNGLTIRNVQLMKITGNQLWVLHNDKKEPAGIVSIKSIVYKGNTYNMTTLTLEEKKEIIEELINQ